ncbi:MAG: hypothetical protein J7K59_02580 [Candidatus Korarchaeota archaeon]|nr:hypothetical protein [Candidatus Korarchaeota archaeon]
MIYSFLRRRIFVFVLIAMLFIVPLSSNLINVKSRMRTETSPKAISDWTFMVYLDADNNLNDYGIDDVNEMEQVGSSSDVNIIVYLDLREDPGRLLRIKSDDEDSINSEILDSSEFWAERNMGDPQTLVDFLNFASANYPADHYALVLWDHGSGWKTFGQSSSTSSYEIESIDNTDNMRVEGICYDETSDNDALTMDELENALSEANIHLDLLAFDACLMGMTEVAYEYKNYADVIVFSEETIPGDGYPYDDILEELIDNPLMSAQELGSTIVDCYSSYYASNKFITLSAIDLSVINNVKNAIDAFALSAIDKISENVFALSCAWKLVDFFVTIEYIDLYHYMELVKAYSIDSELISKAQDVQTAIDSVIINEKHGSMHANAKGMSIYFPFLQATYKQTYGSTINLAEDTNWDEFLSAYWNHGGGGGLMVNGYVLEEITGDNDDIIEPGEVANMTITLQNGAIIAQDNINTTLITRNPYIEIIQNFSTYPAINPGGTASSNVMYTFKVNNTAPESFLTAFQLLINSSFGIWTSEFSIHIGAVNLTVSNGDTLENAIEIHGGDIVTGILPGPGRLNDYYLKVYIEYGKQLTVTLSGDTGTDFDIALLDSGGSIIGESVRTEYPDSIVVVVTASGYYYIHVYPFSGKGTFTLSTTLVNASFVYGSSFYAAIPLKIGQTKSGTLPGVNPYGGTYYVIRAEKGKKYFIKLEGDEGTDFDVWVYDRNGNFVIEARSAIYPDECNFTAEYTGSYYIEVFMDPSSPGGNYRITVLAEGFQINWLIVVAIVVILAIILLVLWRMNKLESFLRAILSIFIIIITFLSRSKSKEPSEQGTTVSATGTTQPKTPKRCPYCKARLAPGTTVCPKCGRKVV